MMARTPWRKREPRQVGSCCACGKPAAPNRAWCRVCLRRIEITGCVETISDYPTRDEAARAWAPGPLEVA